MIIKNSINKIKVFEIVKKPQKHPAMRIIQEIR